MFCFQFLSFPYFKVILRNKNQNVSGKHNYTVFTVNAKNCPNVRLGIVEIVIRQHKVKFQKKLKFGVGILTVVVIPQQLRQNQD